MDIEIMRKLKEMREIVKKELVHIPRKNFDQNMLRQAYWSLRLHSLGKKSNRSQSKEEVLIEATKLVRKDNKSFCPHVDLNFFDQKKLIELSKKDESIKGCFMKKK